MRVRMLKVNQLKFNPRYEKLFPPLLLDELEALRADIKERGIQIPIEVNTRREVLDGYGRAKVAKELGLKTVPVVVRDLHPTEEFIHVVKMNSLRRHLTPLQRAEVIRQVSAKLKASGPKVKPSKGGRPRHRHWVGQRTVPNGTVSSSSFISEREHVRRVSQITGAPPTTVRRSLAVAKPKPKSNPAVVRRFAVQLLDTLVRAASGFNFDFLDDDIVMRMRQELPEGIKTLEALLKAAEKTRLVEEAYGSP